MRIHFAVVFLIFLFTGLTRCETDLVAVKSSSEGQRVYFQYEYINHAWGDQHAGWLLDSDGNLYCYKHPENWNFPDSLGFLSEQEMKHNLLISDSVCYQIPQKELNDKISLIRDAANGTVKEPVHEMYDAGAVSYYAYTYNSDKNLYQRILLKQLGDFRIDNSSSAAGELFRWMQSVNTLIQEE